MAYQLDETLMADNRALIAINPTKESIDRLLKSGMLNYVANENNDLYLTIPRSKDFSEYNRLIQEGPDGKIPYDLTFKGSLTVEKDLVVLGNTTSIDTPSLTIEDNIIEINKNETGSGITLGSAGIQANRGLKGNANWLFTETSDVPNTGAFVFDINGSIKAWIYEDGNFKTLNGVDTQKLTAHGDIVGNATLTLDGAATLKDTLTVNGAASLTGTLGVTGAATLSSSLTALGATWLKSTLKVDGATTLNGALTAGAAATFQNTMTAAGAATLQSTLNVSGVTTLAGALDAKADATFEQNVSVAGVLAVADDVQVGGNLSVTADVYANHIEVAGNANVDQNLYAKNMFLNGTQVTVEGHHQPAASVDYSNVGFPALTDMKKVADYLLYYPIAINSFSNTVGSVEVGQNVASVTLNWTLNKIDIQMQRQWLDQGIGDITPLSARTYSMPSANLKYLTATTYTWTLSAQDEKTSVSATTSIYWRWRRYWGTSASGVVDSATIKALATSTTGGSELATSRSQSRTFDCSGGKYFYFAYPTSWGTPPNLTIGGLSNTAFTTTTVSFTNDYGVTVNYNVVKIDNLQNGSSISVTVN